MNDWTGQFTNELSLFVRGESDWAVPILIGTAFLTTLVIKTFFKLISTRLRRLAKRTVSRWDDVAIDLIDGLRAIVIFAWIFYALLPTLQPSARSYKAAQTIVVLLSAYQAIIWGLYLIRNWKETYLEHRVSKDASAASVMGLLYTGIQGAFLVVIILISLSNLGIDIGALVTGLGVGGVAVALAAQNILGDLLASLSIVIDKPFLVGDAISVDKESGTIERIGLKTTRVRAPTGEEVVFSNKDLLEHRIHNYKSQGQRMIVQNLSVSYSTPPELVEQIPGWVKEFIGKNSLLKFERCHLNKFGVSSLDFEFVFTVNSPDFNVFMDLQQNVLFAIIRKFQSEGIEFAIPARQVFLPESRDSKVATEPKNSAPVASLKA